MPELRTTYRIEELIPMSAANNVPESEWRWNTVWPYVGGSRGVEDHDMAEAKYEALRDEHQTATLRLVMVYEHIERSGRGRVYA